MEIRHAKLEDVDEIYSLMKDLKRDRSAYTKDLVVDLIKTKNSLCLVAIENKNIIAALGARGEGKNSLWLYYLVIKEELRSKGYGEKMMDYLFDEAKKIGVKRIAMDTPEVEYFKKFGFEEVGRIPGWYEDRDQVILFKKIE